MLNIEEIALLLSWRNGIGQALSTEQQLWVSQHYKGLDSFLRSEVGRLAVATFVGDWQASVASLPAAAKQLPA